MWKPILDGSLAERARAALREIAEQIMSVPTGAVRPDHLALFWAYAAPEVDPEGRLSHGDDALGGALPAIERLDSGLGLYGRLVSAAWVVAHVSDDADALLEPVDAVIVDMLARPSWPGHFDLIDGLTGLGVYLLERDASAPGGLPAAARGLELIVRHLGALAERADAGVTWHTGPGFLPDWQRALDPAGHYDCGVAHGVAGVTAFLARVAARPAPPPGARELCAQSMRWLAGESLGPDPRGRFPAWRSAGRPAERARAAWCYGDPGIAAAMWAASLRIGAPVAPWRQVALECAARPAELCGVVDAGLCHGAFGLAHLFNRTYQASGDPRLRDASRAWFERGLSMRRPGRGIGGFLVPYQAEDRSIDWLPSHDLLEGAAGIGLALLAGLRGDPPDWDRLLLADIPVAPGR